MADSSRDGPGAGERGRDRLPDGGRREGIKMDTFRRDLLYSLRALSRSPGFAVVVLATLALGIGANTAIFSVVKGVLLDPLPYRDAQRIVQLYEKRPQQGRMRNVVSAPDFVDWKNQNTVFEGMAATAGASYTLSTE